jgi:hypothetical protein
MMVHSLGASALRENHTAQVAIANGALTLDNNSLLPCSDENRSETLGDTGDAASQTALFGGRPEMTCLTVCSMN